MQKRHAKAGARQNMPRAASSIAPARSTFQRPPVVDTPIRACVGFKKKDDGDMVRAARGAKNRETEV